MKARLKFTKAGDCRWLSHLDLTRALNRACRRAGLPVKYSEGFSPHPRLALSPALPVGVGSLAEYADLLLEEEMDTQALKELLNSVTPKGMEILGAASMPTGIPALSAAVIYADYRLEIFKEVSPEAVSGALTDLSGLTESEIKDTKEDDFKVGKGSVLKLSAPDRHVELEYRMPIGRRLNQMVADLRESLGLPGETIIVDRTAQWVLLNGRLVDPLSA